MDSEYNYYLCMNLHGTVEWLLFYLLDVSMSETWVYWMNDTHKLKLIVDHPYKKYQFLQDGHRDRDFIAIIRLISTTNIINSLVFTPMRVNIPICVYAQTLAIQFARWTFFGLPITLMPIFLLYK